MTGNIGNYHIQMILTSKKIIKIVSTNLIGGQAITGYFKMIRFNRSRGGQGGLNALSDLDFTLGNGQIDLRLTNLLLCRFTGSDFVYETTEYIGVAQF